jgi:uncharacterized protein YneF (UPF0154 family)
MSDKFMEWLSGACVGFLVGAYVQRKTMQEEIRNSRVEKEPS